MVSTPGSTSDRRQSLRQETGLLHISAAVTHQGAPLGGEIIDLRRRGMRLLIRASAPGFAEGTAMVVGLSTSVDPDPLMLPAVVRWQTQAEGGQAPDIVLGLEFVDLDDDTAGALAAFLEITRRAEGDLEGTPTGEELAIAARRDAEPDDERGPLATRPSHPGRADDAAQTVARPAGQAPAAGPSGPELARLISGRIVLVSGKGGVGRTTVAAALARAAAASGRRVLVADIGDPDEGQCPLAHALGLKELSMDPGPVAPGIEACHLWARRGHELFFTSVLPIRALVRVAVGSRFLRVFLEAAPSFHEMGVFYHLLALLREKRADGHPRHDLIIVDMPATGHALALTGLPRILLRLIPGGPIVRLLKEGQSYLNDPKQAAAWIVTLPEMLPVSEALELLAGMQESEMPVGGVILNRLPDTPFTAEERAVVEDMLAQRPTYGGLTFKRISVARAAYERLKAAVRLPILTLPESWEEGHNLVQTLAIDIRRAVNSG